MGRVGELECDLAVRESENGVDEVEAPSSKKKINKKRSRNATEL